MNVDLKSEATVRSKDRTWTGHPRLRTFLWLAARPGVVIAGHDVWKTDGRILLEVSEWPDAISSFPVIFEPRIGRVRFPTWVRVAKVGSRSEDSRRMTAQG